MTHCDEDKGNMASTARNRHQNNLRKVCYYVYSVTGYSTGMNEKRLFCD